MVEKINGTLYYNWEDLMLGAVDFDFDHERYQVDFDEYLYSDNHTEYVMWASDPATGDEIEAYTFLNVNDAMEFVPTFIKSLR